MAGMIQVTPQALREKANELRSQNRTLKSQIESLSSQQESLNGMWEGEAHDTFRREFLKDVSRMEEFCAAIEQYASALETIAVKYETAENKNISVASTRSV